MISGLGRRRRGTRNTLGSGRNPCNAFVTRTRYVSPDSLRTDTDWRLRYRVRVAWFPFALGVTRKLVKKCGTQYSGILLIMPVPSLVRVEEEKASNIRQRSLSIRSVSIFSGFYPKMLRSKTLHREERLLGVRDTARIQDTWYQKDC